MKRGSWFEFIFNSAVIAVLTGGGLAFPFLLLPQVRELMRSHPNLGFVGYWVAGFLVAAVMVGVWTKKDGGKLPWEMKKSGDSDKAAMTE